MLATQNVLGPKLSYRNPIYPEFSQIGGGVVTYNGLSLPYVPVSRNFWMVDNHIPTSNNQPVNHKTFTIEITEAVVIPPLNWGYKETKGLLGLTDVQLTYNLDTNEIGNCIKSWVYGTHGGVTNGLTIDVRFGGVDQNENAELLLQYMRMREFIQPPPFNRYQYSRITRKAVDLGAMTHGAARPSSTGNLDLVGVPKRLYLYARRKAPTQYYQPDTFAHIDNLVVDYAISNNGLAGATRQHIYQMCAKNGYDGDFSEFYGKIGSGSVICIDLAEDLGLPATDAVGVSRNLQLSIQCNVNADVLFQRSNANLSVLETSVNVELICLVVYDGICTIKDGSVDYKINPVTISDVVSAMNIRKIPYDTLATFAYGGSFAGGSFGSFVKSAAKKFSQAKKFAEEKVIPGVKQALPYIEKAADAAQYIPILAQPASAVKAATKIAEKVLPLIQSTGGALSEDQLYTVLKAKGGKSITKADVKKGMRMYKAGLMAH
jgi:hypothetical protein